MTKTSYKSLTAKLAVAGFVAVLLTAFSLSPAGACEQPHNSQTVARQPLSSAETVRVTQVSPGSFSGILEWPVTAGATQYYIYKTGTIRPYWRLFWVAPGNMNALEVVDKPGAVAVYRVVAIVDGREVALGRFNYRPRR